jgi:hypothetical protein
LLHNELAIITHSIQKPTILKDSRDKKGRFVKGRIEDVLMREKRLESLRIASKNRSDYLGELKKHPLYNIWRSFRFTKKGKKIGNNPEWDKFKDFYTDVLPFYEEGKRFNRKDVSKPFSKDNYIFLSDKQVASRQKTEKLLTYKGETKPLEEWIIHLDLNKEGVRIRYYTGIKFNHTAERILFGIRYNKSKKIKDHKQLETQQIRNKASKMIASYNNKDKKRGYEKSDLTIDWFIENIFKKTCIYCNDTERIGADRVDNSKNHDMNNIVPCCYECNVARSNNFTHKEMLTIGKSIEEIKKKRKNKK